MSLKVAELIDQQTRQWKTEIIEDIFDTASAQTILALPLSATGEEDLVLWRPENTGAFSGQDCLFGRPS